MLRYRTSKHLLVWKSSSRRLQDMSGRCLQHVFSVTTLRLPRRLQDFFKTSWKTKNCYAKDVLKTSWRHYGDKQNTYWGYRYLTNLNVYLTNLYFTNLYLTILRRIQNALIRTQFVLFFKFVNNVIIRLILELKQHLYFKN